MPVATKTLPLTSELLKLTEKPYEEFNAVLETVRTRFPLDVQYETFNKVLSEELVNNPLRRATRIAIRVAMGENVDRELKPFKPSPPFGEKKKKKKLKK